MRGLLCVVALSACTTPSGTADRGAPPLQSDAVLQPIEDDPSLPRVLLIGDSISMGYTLAVRERLRGVANVHRPPVNCAATTFGVQNLRGWLGDEPWDVIHFNFGLHDTSHKGEHGECVAPDNGTRMASPEAYEQNLRVIVAELEKTDAVLIWASTTPIPPGTQAHLVGDAARYNEIAARVMAEHDIRIDDLWSFAQPHMSEWMLPSDIHFNAAGSDALAEHVAGEIAVALPPR